MKLFELDEASEVIKSINGMLLLFSLTPRTAQLVKEYLTDLILELQDQDLIKEAETENDMEIDLSKQIAFLQGLIDTLELPQTAGVNVLTNGKHSN